MTRRATTPPDLVHWHRCIVTRVADGDTVRVDATLGLGVEMRHEPVRLLGIQAPELRGPERWAAAEARRYLSSMTLERPLLMHVPGGDRDVYGRWLAWLWIPDRDHLLSVNRAMVDAGLARAYAPTRHRYDATLPPPTVQVPTL